MTDSIHQMLNLIRYISIYFYSWPQTSKEDAIIFMYRQKQQS